jgi:Bax protein
LEYIFLTFLTFLEHYAKGEETSSPLHTKKPSVRVGAKKKSFYARVLPPIIKVYNQLDTQYKDIANNINNPIYKQKIEKLKKRYKVQSDTELLMALKPHPKSIALAQAAMESAWGTSRFFQEANNIFGMWSTNPKEQRIAANEQRDGKRTIWLRKFDSLEDSVRAYYLTLSRADAYKEFRKRNFETDDVFEIIQGLTNYSERGEAYVKELASMIQFNNFTQYDTPMQTKLQK